MIGTLIVIEGSDGSGKTTQSHLLVNYLKHNSLPVKYFDFPQYYNSFHGKIIARYLRGELGNMREISPYLITLAFALDRASVKKEMDRLLKKGGYIIANRYATSSMVYQSAKFKRKKEQNAFLKWNYELEYMVNKIPHETVVIYLYVPWRIGKKLTRKKANRAYLNGKKEDIHETDLEYRKAVESMYMQLSKKYKHWVTIDCVEKNKILPPHIIHEKILKLLKDKNILI